MDWLLIPSRDIANHQLVGLQAFDSQGHARELGSTEDGVLLLGNTRQTSQPWYVVAEYATAVRIVFTERNGDSTCACCFHRSRIIPVAVLIEEIFAPQSVLALVGPS